MTWGRINSFLGNSTAEALTEHRPCPVCGSLRFRPVVALADFQFFSDSRALPKRVAIHQVQCADCFALAMNPCYSRYGFEVLFPEAEQSYGTTAERTDEQVGWMADRGMLEHGRAVLDVGCYDALLLERLPKHVRKQGVDIDANAVERGRERLRGQDVELVHGDFETFELTHIPDTIMMFHVLEHLVRPVDVLRKLRTLAHPDSRLVVEVPIVENGSTNDLVGFFTVQHLTHFSRRSLQNCLARSGWLPLEWAVQTQYNGCRVVAEPAEPLRLTAGDPHDTIHAARCAAGWHSSAIDVSRALEPTLDARRCIVWGAGMHTEYLYQRTPLFQSSAEREYALVDSDPRKQGQTWRGIPIHPPEALNELATTDAPIIVSTYGSQEEVVAAVAAFDVDVTRIVRLYDRVDTY